MTTRSHFYVPASKTSHRRVPPEQEVSLAPPRRYFHLRTLGTAPQANRSKATVLDLSPPPIMVYIVLLHSNSLRIPNPTFAVVLVYLLYGLAVRIEILLP